MSNIKIPTKLGQMSVTFQKNWYKKNKMSLPVELTGSVAQANKEIKPGARAQAMRANSYTAYGATKGTPVGGSDGNAGNISSTIKPLTRDQHSKIAAAIAAAKRAVKSTAKPAPIESKQDRLSFLKKAFKKAKDPKRFDIPTLDPDDENAEDLRDLHQSLHVSGSYNEEVDLDEATPYYNKPSFLKKMGRIAKQEQQRIAKQEQQAREKKSEIKSPVLHEPPGYANRVSELEKKGMTTSDAQGIADSEVMQGKHKDRVVTKPLKKAIGRAMREQLKKEETMNKIIKENQVSEDLADVLGTSVGVKKISPPGPGVAKPQNRAGILARKALKKAFPPLPKVQKEEVETVDEEKIQRTAAVATDGVTRLAFRAGTPDEVKKNHKEIYKKLKRTNPEKAAKFKKTFKVEEEVEDKGEYDYEGDMAMSQLKSVITNAQRLHDMMEPDTNLPEWVQSKITLAEDYIVTAANYMEGQMDEEVEQVDVSENFSSNRLPPSNVPDNTPSVQTVRTLDRKTKKPITTKYTYKNGELVDTQKVSEAKLDPVGKEDSDIDNDGKTTKTDDYLNLKRDAIRNAIKDKLKGKK